MSELKVCSKDFNPHILFFYRKTKTKLDKAIPLHSHDYLFINYITFGSACYHVDDQTFTVSKGDVVIINPDAVHTREALSDEFSVFDIGITNLKFKNLPHNHFLGKNENNVIRLTHSESTYYDCYREILSLQESKEYGWKLFVKTLIMKQLILLMKESLPPTSSSKSGYVVFDSYEKDTITENMIRFMTDNYKSKITLDNLTKNSYLSSVYLYKIFKEATGETPINYLIQIRMNKAKELLAENILSIKEIAPEIGYEDYYYFSKLFKKNVGMSPSKYRELLCKRKVDYMNKSFS